MQNMVIWQYEVYFSVAVCSVGVPSIANKQNWLWLSWVTRDVLGVRARDVQTGKLSSTVFRRLVQGRHRVHQGVQLGIWRRVRMLSLRFVYQEPTGTVGEVVGIRYFQPCSWWPAIPKCTNDQPCLPLKHVVRWCGRKGPRLRMSSRWLRSQHHVLGLLVLE